MSFSTQASPPQVLLAMECVSFTGTEAHRLQLAGGRVSRRLLDFSSASTGVGGVSGAKAEENAWSHIWENQVEKRGCLRELYD